MRIAIAGGLGFTGSSIAIQALKAGYEVAALTRSHPGMNHVTHPRFRIFSLYIPSELAEWRTAIKESDAVILAIGEGGPSKALTNAQEEISHNLIPTIRLVEECLECSAKKIVLLSSAGTVYGEVVRTPATEESALNPVGLYGATKAAQEMYSLAMCAKSQTRVVIARLSNPYGPWQLPGRGQGLISNAIHAAETSGQFNIWGTGDETRDYIYIDDASQAILDICAAPAEGIINICTSLSTSTNQILSILEEATGKSMLLSRSNPEFPLPSRLSLCNLKLRKTLEWDPKVRLPEGICKTIEWHREVYSQIDHSPNTLAIERINQINRIVK